MPTTREKVAKLVKEGFLTEKQGDKLTPNYALIVGERNKKNKRKPVKSLPDNVWAKKVEERKKSGGKAGKINNRGKGGKGGKKGK